MQGIRDDELSARCTNIAQQVVNQETTYSQLAVAGQLSTWSPHPRGDDAAASIGLVTRGEFKWLYTKQLAQDGSKARNFYDQIKGAVPNNICPYCGFGAVETLDHFLPKAHYSSLSVLPLNLIPACRDCNVGKNASVVTQMSMHCHPYFEEDCVLQDEWLFASIVRAAVPFAEFTAHPPACWHPSITQRVQNHFSEFDLARRFSIQAAERLNSWASMIDDLRANGTNEEVRTFLLMAARSEQKACGVNSWQAALIKAVANDAWFHTTGYKLLL
ncbi:HNH endonuclease [Alcaligenes faecalis subsp. faecalis]|nr:HNH endonuclease [Alcaligenes faecalis subsp. faecalis]